MAVPPRCRRQRGGGCLDPETPSPRSSERLGDNDAAYDTHPIFLETEGAFLSAVLAICQPTVLSCARGKRVALHLMWLVLASVLWPHVVRFSSIILIATATHEYVLRPPATDKRPTTHPPRLLGCDRQHMCASKHAIGIRLTLPLCARVVEGIVHTQVATADPSTTLKFFSCEYCLNTLTRKKGLHDCQERLVRCTGFRRMRLSQ